MNAMVSLTRAAAVLSALAWLLVGGNVVLAVEPPEGVPAYAAQSAPDKGRHLALFLEKLTQQSDPPRSLLIWAIGSSYTNKLGSGDELIELVRQRFPQAPTIVYRKMVGNAVPWQYLRGWARHLVIPDQPDLVLIYTLGDPADLEKLIVELRRHTTADIIVPTLHFRVPDQEFFARGDDDAPYWDQVRDICRRHSVELVENRRDWGAFLRQHKLPVEALLADNVHQIAYGAHVIRSNIAAHIAEPDAFAYDPRSRLRRVELEQPGTSTSETLSVDEHWNFQPSGVTTSTAGARLALRFTGTRVDVVGTYLPNGGTLRIKLDGRPADQVDAYWATYIQPDRRNVQLPGRADPVRDKSPHGVLLGSKQVPQAWTITMTSDDGDYELTGSVTGADGRGNSARRFTSTSGQITIEPELWRRAEGNRTGDKFTFEVYRTTLAALSFRREPPQEKFRAAVLQNLPLGEHLLELEALGDGPVTIDALEVHQPPDASP